MRNSSTEMLLSWQTIQNTSSSQCCDYCLECFWHKRPSNTSNQGCPNLGIVVLAGNKKRTMAHTASIFRWIQLIWNVKSKNVIHFPNRNTTCSNTRKSYHNGIAMTLLWESATKIVMPHHLLRRNQTQVATLHKKYVMHHSYSNIWPQEMHSWQRRTPHWQTRVHKRTQSSSSGGTIACVIAMQHVKAFAAAMLHCSNVFWSFVVAL